MVHICADERVRIVIAREEFVDDDPFINKIDAKRAASKLPLLILEIVRRTYDSGNPARAEMLLQETNSLDVGRSFQSRIARFGTPVPPHSR